MRIDKFLSSLKYGSREQIKQAIKQKRIKINDFLCQRAEQKINPQTDVILFDGNKIFYKEEITLILNKPKGYLCANKDNLHPTIFELIKEPYNRFDLKMAGRLDLDSRGLMILTTSGELVHNLTHPSKKVNKVYQVLLDKPLTKADADVLIKGIELVDPQKRKYHAYAIDLTYQDVQATITINEGKFHQVKKMFEKIGYQVLDLNRIKYGNIVLNIELGSYQEIDSLKLMEKD